MLPRAAQAVVEACRLSELLRAASNAAVEHELVSLVRPAAVTADGLILTVWVSHVLHPVIVRAIDLEESGLVEKQAPRDVLDQLEQVIVLQLHQCFVLHDLIALKQKHVEQCRKCLRMIPGDVTFEHAHQLAGGEVTGFFRARDEHHPPIEHLHDVDKQEEALSLIVIESEGLQIDRSGELEDPVGEERHVLDIADFSVAMCVCVKHSEQGLGVLALIFLALVIRGLVLRLE